MFQQKNLWIQETLQFEERKEEDQALSHLELQWFWVLAVRFGNGHKHVPGLDPYPHRFILWCDAFDFHLDKRLKILAGSRPLLCSKFLISVLSFILQGVKFH